MNPQGQFQAVYHKQPILVYDQETFHKTMHLVNTWDLECQWYHRIEKSIINDRPVYLLSDIFIPKQECAGAEVESDGIAVAQMWRDLKEARGLTPAQLGEITRTAGAWCHSHVNMSTGPSTTDDKQWAEQLQLTARATSPSPQVMLILNKKNEYYARIYDPELDVTWVNPKIVVDYGVDYSDINYAIENLLSKAKPKVVTTNTGISNPGQKSWLPGSNSYGAHHNSHSSTTHQLGGSSKTSHGHLTTKTQTSKKTETVEQSSASWKEKLKSESYLKVSKEKSDAVLGLIKQINSTVSEKQQKPLLDALSALITEQLIVEDEGWYMFATLTTGSDKEIENLTDQILNPKKLPHQQYMLSCKDSFVEYLTTMTIEPPEKVTQALQVANWLSGIEDTDIVEGLIEVWLKTYAEDLEEVEAQIPAELREGNIYDPEHWENYVGI